MKASQRTAGATLIVTVLIVMLMMAAILAVTAQFSLSTRRTSADQDATLRAQYAAEAGVARSQTLLAQIRASMATGRLSQTSTTDATLQAYFANFCGVQVSALAAFAATPLAQPRPICQGTTSSAAGTMFAQMVPSASYPAGWTAATWNDVFDADGLQLATAALPGATADVSLKLTPIKVEQLDVASYRLQVRVEKIRSTGKITGGSRNISLGSNTVFNIMVTRPAFAVFAQFRNKTTATGGGNLYFAAGEAFNGPVHTNAPLRLSGNGVSGPVFNDEVSTAAAEANVDYQGLPCTKPMIAAGSCTAMFPNGNAPSYGVPSIPLPTNNSDQLRASLGLDPDPTAPALTDTQLKANLGLAGSGFGSGVYYAKTTSPTSLMGGIYLRGDADVRLSTTGTPGRQKIDITQGSVVTRFEQQSDQSWRVSTGSGGWTTLSGSFNGLIYGDGNVNLSGDGSTAPDIAAGSALTITNRNGDIRIKNSVTYTDDPLVNPNAVNVLGLFNSTGSILLDGPLNENMNVNASILASTSGEGFGTVNPSGLRYTQGGQTPFINLTGGVIEDQSQTVAISPGGYKRKYSYDPRFRRGYAPPFFPLQQRWTVTPDSTFDTGLWKQDK